MKTLVIGDVHGAGLELQALLEQEKVVAGEDRVFLVGDVFDRGMHGHVVWDLIKKYNMVVTKGNHEVKMSKWLHGLRKDVPPHYIWAINNFVANDISLDEILSFIDSMPLLVEASPGVIVTHAGVHVDDPYKEELWANVYGNLPPEMPMPRPKPGDKDAYWWDHYKKNTLVLYGHLVTYNGKPRINYAANGEINSIGLDTATVHGGCCTAYCIETKTVHQYCSGVNYYQKLKDEFRKKYQEPNSDVLNWFDSRK